MYNFYKYIFEEENCYYNNFLNPIIFLNLKKGDLAWICKAVDFGTTNLVIVINNISQISYVHINNAKDLFVYQQRASVGENRVCQKLLSQNNFYSPNDHLRVLGNLINSGQKLLAVKIYAKLYDCDLFEGKKQVEEYSINGHW